MLLVDLHLLQLLVVLLLLLWLLLQAWGMVIGVLARSALRPASQLSFPIALSIIALRVRSDKQVVRQWFSRPEAKNLRLPPAESIQDPCQSRWTHPARQLLHHRRQQNWNSWAWHACCSAWPCGSIAPVAAAHSRGLWRAQKWVSNIELDVASARMTRTERDRIHNNDIDNNKLAHQQHHLPRPWNTSTSTWIGIATGFWSVLQVQIIKIHGLFGFLKINNICSSRFHLKNTLYFCSWDSPFVCLFVFFSFFCLLF